MGVEVRIIQALWFILPAYFANSAPVQFSKIGFLEKYGKPIDGGKEWHGVRLLGDGKTWRGFFVGVLGGTLMGLTQAMFQSDATVLLRGILGLPGLVLPQMHIELAFMLSLGTLVGDMIASFVKRRANLRSGDPAPLLDQLDFVFGAFFFAWLLTKTLDYDRFFVVVVITPILHIIANFIAWIWKLKRNPW
ncbi:MAG: CDP-2,3-bis-(O-geranylgeranyl)-sn-glycerol synthase [Candidatus Altiarchaeota archaeon]|nr:CDP-2,3-bis-(O-geranylgeranyl)-sn-glycerol synthase [Candidatus Altiarchaeota archaeon]